MSDIENERAARFKYLALRLHALGPKPPSHSFNGVERGADLRAHLKGYAALPADFIKSYGGHRFVKDDRFSDPR